MNMDESKPQLTVFIEDAILPAEAEEIEDDIAEYLGNRQHKGKVEDSITGNTTTFQPNEGYNFDESNLNREGEDEQLLSVADAQAKAIRQ